MIVDDSQFARQSLKNALRDLKYTHILEFGDVPSARAYLGSPEYAQAPAALLFTDINMPEETGIDLLKWARAQMHLKSLPVIVLTASQDKGNILDAGRLGVSSFIIKPFDVATLKERMSSAYARTLKPVSN